MMITAAGYHVAVFHTFLVPVTMALSVFPLVVLIVMLPVAVVSYRRRGRAGGWTTLVFYCFLFYLLAAALQTVVPLPSDPAGYCAAQNYASTPQLRPFYFVQVLQERAQGDWSLASVLHYGAVWSTALNIALLLPLGFFLRYLAGLRFLAATSLAAGVSLLFELTQLTGLWFVYPCAYRLFSVDDLMLNTAGAVVGWLLAGPVGRLLPALDPDRERRRYATKVTVSRRVFALLADAVGFVVLTGLVVGLIVLFGGPAAARGPVIAVLAAVWFLLVPLLTGSTVGKHAMLLRVARTNGRRAGPVSLLVRNGVLYSPLWLLWLALSVDHWDVVAHPAQLLIPAGMVLSLFLVGIWTPLAVFFGDEAAPHERLSRTENVAVVDGPKRARTTTTAVKASA
jgi:glycopeptide antibiotics resistance protein